MNKLSASVLSFLVLAPALVGPQRVAVAQTGRVYGLLEGSYVWSFGTTQNERFDDGLVFTYPVNNLKVEPDKGWAGRVGGGVFVNPRFDIGLVLGGTFLSRGEKSEALPVTCAPCTATSTNHVSQKAWFMTADLEAGYWVPGSSFGLRLSGGLRTLYVDHSLDGRFHADLIIPNSDIDDVSRNDTKYFGVGPRLGANVWVPFGNSGLGLTGQLAGALVLGSLKEKSRFTSTTTPNIGSPVTTVSNSSDSKFQTAATLDADLGLYYALPGSSGLAFALGWRFQGLWGGADKSFEGDAKGNGNRFVHGPFARLTVNFGGKGPRGGGDVFAEDDDGGDAPPPRGRRVASGNGQPAPPPAPAAAQVDFSGSSIVLSQQGVATIAQAAAQARAGQASTLAVSSQRIPGQPDSYFGQLRTEIVRAELRRKGVPESHIAVGAARPDARVVILAN